MLKIASAGSTVFGARAAAALYAQTSADAVVSGFEIVTDHGHLLFERARAGALAADIVMLPTDMIAGLAATGVVAGETRTALGTVEIGAAVRRGHERLEVSMCDALLAALRASEEIVLTLAPTGEHMMEVIARLGLRDELATKIRRFDKSSDVNAYVARSPQRALAFGPATEIFGYADRGIAWAGPVPDEFQVRLAYEAAALAQSPLLGEVRGFLRFLSGRKGREAFAATGVVASG
ncbi:MAG: molybdate ABC transporter substrate-binding protein [Beijerinckiaceae bacterium]